MSLKRQLYLFHRWAGIVLCLFFALWFFSGVFMMYVEFPQLNAPERRAGAAELDFSSATVTPTGAVANLKAGDFATAGTPLRNVSVAVVDPSAPVTNAARVHLSMLTSRPVYRIEVDSKAQPRVVFADDGTVLRSVTPALAGEELAGFLKRSGRAAPLSYLGVVQTDQWTVSAAMNPHRPLHKFSVSDARGTVMYVSSSTGEVVRDSSRRERVLNYFGAVTHWLYPTIIRKFPDAWAWMVDILSSAGTALAITGVWIGILRWQRRPGRGVTPYKGLMKWHHLTGLAFGVVTITWVFSGLMSMNPGDLNPPRSPSKEEALVFSGKRFAPEDFELPGIRNIGMKAVEAELFHFDARPYIKATARDGATRVVDAGPGALTPPIETQAAASLDHDALIGAAAQLREKLHRLMPDAPLLQIETLHRYDDYYYSRRPENGGRVLPVMRARFGDSAQTWFHIDPQTGQILERSSRTNRIYRWLYNGLHSFDILWLWERRPLWDIVVIAFSLGGLALSIIGVIAGVKRLRWELS